MIFFGERSLRRATRDFVAHYHAERYHQGLDNRLIEPRGVRKHDRRTFMGILPGLPVRR